jgi:hypothetical protein
MTAIELLDKEVLYIGPYRQNDEWGKTSRAFLQLLLHTVKKVVARPLYYSNNIVELGEIKEEHSYVEEKDVIIQHGLPETLNYEGDFNYNIAITKVDCRIDNLSWVENLKLFDKICVFSPFEKELLKESGIKESKIFAFDFPPVLNEPKEAIELEISELENKTVFYTTAGPDDDSGLMETLTAYYHCFSSIDNVILIVFDNNSEIIKRMVEQIKAKMNCYGSSTHYPDIAIISNDPRALAYAHLNYDYYINVSYNLSTNQEILECLMGKSIPILLDTAMFLEGCYPSQNWQRMSIVLSRTDVCQKNNRPLPNMYSGKHYWKVPDTAALCKALKICSETSSSLLNKKWFKNNHKEQSHGKLKELLCIR